MFATLTIARYRTAAIPLALVSMALFRIPLSLNRKISFYKLMGSGKNGTFDKVPDLKQWAIMAVHRGLPKRSGDFYGSFIKSWFKLFCKEVFTIVLEPVEGHGKWDGAPVFGELNKRPLPDGPVAVLTRATIRVNKLKYFWKQVAPVTNELMNTQGFIFSVGIGEIPWIKQATFSVWRSRDEMKKFAYKSQAHQKVIRLTRDEHWYSEDMFIRFTIIDVSGTLHGVNPLANAYI